MIECDSCTLVSGDVWSGMDSTASLSRSAKCSPNPFFVDDPELGQLSSVNALTAEVFPLRIGLGSPAWLKMRGSDQGWFPHTLTQLDCRCILKYC